MFAQDLARRLQDISSGHVLELAAGSGIVTRALARTLPAAVAITATDLNPAMLRQAKSNAGLIDCRRGRYSRSPREAAISQCHGGIVRNAIDAQMPDRLDEITETAAAAIAARFGNGSIGSPLHAMLYSAVRWSA
jgi:predicted nicotinamide N-methyase